MEFEILGNPDFGEARAKLGAGDSFHAASGAMNWHRGPVSFRAKLMGGFFRSLFRKILGGTSMTAWNGPFSIVFTTQQPVRSKAPYTATFPLCSRTTKFTS